MTRRGPYRIARGGDGAFGAALQPGRSLSFRFNGRGYTGSAGDTLASALLANGVRTVGRSFKFHRPRGVFSCGFEEPNALVQLGEGASTIPSVRSTLIDLCEGLEAHAPSGWPSLDIDFARALDFTAPLWVAGFYNKLFKWPSWRIYEPAMRHMAGFGTAPTQSDPDRYETQHLHCEVLIIGGGAAGLREAQEAAEQGARVVLVEQSPQLGGRAGWDGSRIGGKPGDAWVRDASAQLARTRDVRVLTNTFAAGHYGHGVTTLVESVPREAVKHGAARERYWIVRAQRLVIATGAIEQPLIFCNNDRPGIVLAGAAHAYLRRYGVAVGRRVVVATNNDSAYGAAKALQAAGVEVLAITDSRHVIDPAIGNEMRSLSIPVLTASMPIDSHGFGALTGVSIGRLSDDDRRVEPARQFACDALAVSGGWNPSLAIFAQAGGKLAYRNESRALEPIDSPKGVSVVGAAAGTTADAKSPAAIGARVSPFGRSDRQWVDLRHDVTVADLELAIRENYSSIEHVKRYTTVGMANDQGKTSNVATLEIVARLRSLPVADLGHTTPRPPVMPVTLGAIAGRAVGDRFAPSRRLPLHEWHVAHGAVMEDFGEWKRPTLYLEAGESRAQAIAREALAVRTCAGLLDGSSLGKIEVRGPDALEFLDRFYINNLMTLRPGRARYGIMLRESGIVLDDGTVVMLGPDRFLITTTSGNAGRIANWLQEWRQCEWPRLRVACTPVTDQWAVLSLTGPRAREILANVPTDIDLSGDAFPHLGVREGQVLGVPARIYRVSFTGELGYEINVPAKSASAVWEALWNAGQSRGLQPLGLDALMLLRMEKGFLHIGTDTDGTTVPADVGWGHVAAAKTADFIGKRSLHLPEHVRADRLQLVGLVGDTDLVAGGHLRLEDSRAATDGWVTSAGRAALTGEPLGLALLRGGRARTGASVTVHDAGKMSLARVVGLPHFDSNGSRMHA
ncbi:MAG: 2Fe-2S iron-sulfur cluster-binding protein [Gammaproteobacteria bacterium]